MFQPFLPATNVFIVAACIHTHGKAAVSKQNVYWLEFQGPYSRGRTEIVRFTTSVARTAKDYMQSPIRSTPLKKKASCLYD
jgi:hypothetical protein